MRSTHVWGFRAEEGDDVSADIENILLHFLIYARADWTRGNFLPKFMKIRD
jgi:hypothetical protein